MVGIAPQARGPDVQRPDLYRFPELAARAWYEPDSFPWIGTLEDRWREARAELEALLEQPGSFTPFADGDGAAYREEKFGLRDRRDSWTVYDLLSFEGAARCPRAAALVAEALGEPLLAQFSRLRPGTHLPPHCGLSNDRLTVHLGLSIPPGCTIRVGSETRAWREGECLVFDDSFEHEVWHLGERDRVVLLARFWHPDLTAIEIEGLLAIEEEVGPLLGATAQERMIALDLLRRPV